LMHAGILFSCGMLKKPEKSYFHLLFIDDKHEGEYVITFN